MNKGALDALLQPIQSKIFYNVHTKKQMFLNDRAPAVHRMVLDTSFMRQKCTP